MRAVARIGGAAMFAAAALVAGNGLAEAALVKSTADPTWQTDGRVRAIVISGGRIYIGGDFTHVRAAGAPAPGGAVRNHLAAIDAATGALLPWNPNANGQVRALRVKPGGKTIYAGGKFTRIGGKPRSGIAAIATHGSTLRAWHPRVNDAVNAILATPKRVYLGGAFTIANGASRNRLAAISAAPSAKLLAWRPGVHGGDVRALALSASGGRLFVGGLFTTVNGKAHLHLAAIDTATGKTRKYGAQPAWPVTSLVSTPLWLFAGGSGNGGQVASYNAKNGARHWLAITDGDVQALALRQGVLYVGGHFTNYCQGGAGTGNPLVCTTPVSRRHLLALNAATANLTAWNADANSIHGVFALRASKSQVAAGGDFTVVHGANQQGIAKFTA